MNQSLKDPSEFQKSKKQAVLNSNQTPSKISLATEWIRSNIHFTSHKKTKPAQLYFEEIYQSYRSTLSDPDTQTLTVAQFSMILQVLASLSNKELVRKTTKYGLQYENITWKKDSKGQQGLNNYDEPVLS